MRCIGATGLVLILALVSLSAAQQAETAAIEGTVLIAGSREPIAGARVTVTVVPPQGAPRSGSSTAIPPATTDATGRFALRDVAPGSYTLAVMANGYASQEHRGPIALAPRQTLRNLAISLVPGGSLSGRVQNTSGRPLAGVSVDLLRRTYSATGQPSLRLVTTAGTNDLGEYRFYWLSPGRYFISARGRGGGGVLTLDPVSTFDNAVRRGINEVAENHAAAFFPGVADEDRAVPIDLLPGADVRGIDFTLPRAKG